MHLVAFVMGFFMGGGLPSSEEVVGTVVERLAESVGVRGEGEEYTQEELEGAKNSLMRELLLQYEEEQEALELYLYSERSLREVSLTVVNAALSPSPESHEQRLFLQLPLSPTDEATIYEIISTVGRKNIFTLLFEKSKLKRKGKQIEHLHPLRFLGAIFSNQQLKASMKEIHRSGFKWDGFMDGLVPKMREEDRRGNLLPYVGGFCAHLRVDQERVTHFIHRRNWDGLVRYLL